MLKKVIATLLLLGAGLPASANPIIIGETVTISSNALSEQRAINVYLPPEYSKNDDKYPVLYLIDGGLDQDFLHIAGSAQLGSIYARSQSVIIVGVETKDRRKELVGPTRDPALLEKYPTAGSSAAFRDFLRNDVKPLISEKYRTSGYDGIIGESLAGLFIVETYLREPSLFDRFAAVSPSMWWDKERLSFEAAGFLSKQGLSSPPLYVSIANEGEDMQAGVDRLLAALDAKPGWCYVPHPEHTHSTIYQSTAPEALQFLFPTQVRQDPQSGFELKCAKKGRPA